VEGIPHHPLNNTLTNTPTLLYRGNLGLQRALNSFDHKPDTRSLRQFDRRFRPKTAVLENRVHQFHCLTSIAPRYSLGNAAEVMAETGRKRRHGRDRYRKTNRKGICFSKPASYRLKSRQPPVHNSSTCNPSPCDPR
jgi:hypothetical protein